MPLARLLLMAAAVVLATAGPVVATEPDSRAMEFFENRGWAENPPELADIDRLLAQTAALNKSRPSPPVVIGIREGGIPGANRERIGDAPIYVRGDHRKLGPVVPRRFPTILAGDQQTPLGRLTAGSGRLELANWMAASDHPLTARVMVNRVWQHLFGEGLVRTPDNFGMLGERPTHPELLDHLSRRFVANDWSVKKLIRDIVLSNTYRQTSFADKGLDQSRPRQPPARPHELLEPRDEWERGLRALARNCGVSLSNLAVSSQGLYD